MQKNTADWHRADVVAALKKVGWSVRALSIASGLGPNTLKNALSQPYPKAERIIADALGRRFGRNDMQLGISVQRSIGQLMLKRIVRNKNEKITHLNSQPLNFYYEKCS